MNIAERLKNAYENVAYSGDDTWINDSFSYQKANLELYTREQQLSLLNYSQLRPRDVKECIPKSKLAQYDNYVYDEARELSYNANVARYFTPLRLSEELFTDGEKEPWMLPEIDELYVWFLNFQNSVTKQDEHEDLKGGHPEYESPLLRARFFDENVLRFFVTSDRIKNLWDVNIVVKEFNEKTITVYRSPFGDYYVPQEQMNQYFTLPEQNSDVESIKALTQSLMKQRCSTSKKEAVKKVIPEVAPITTKHDTEPERRLYSAVLQGLSPKVPALKSTNDQMTLLTKKNEEKKGFKKLTSLNKVQKPLEDSQVIKKVYQDEGESSCVLTSTFNKLTSTKTKVVEDVCGTSHYINTHTTFMSNTNYFQATSSVASPVVTNTFTTTSSPIGHSPTYVNNYTNYQFSSHYTNSSYHQTNNCLYSNNTYCNVSQVVANRSLYSRNYVPNTYHLYPPSLFMLQQNRTSTIYPQLNTSAFIHQTQQQTHFYNHPVTLPRVQNSNYIRYNLPIQRSSFTPSMPHQYIQPSSTPVNWLIQNQYQNIQHYDSQTNRMKIKTKKAPPPIIMAKPKTRSQEGSITSLEEPTTIRTKPKIIRDDFEEVVSKTVGAVLEERPEDKFVPIQVSVSEVLELEALEQYNQSNDVYQELERQAAEQYDEFPENWKGPPNCNPFGGVFYTITIYIP